jgi:hypothetical protein
MVWCGIWDNKIVGPVFFDTNMNTEMYPNMPQDTIMPSLLDEDGEFPAYFQQDGFITSLWYLLAPMVGSAVPGLVAVVLLSGLQGPQSSARSIFSSDGT